MARYLVGTAIRVVNTAGNSIEYVQQFDPSDLSFGVHSAPSNPLTMNDVLNEHGSHPYCQAVQPDGGSVCWSQASTQLTTVSAAMSVTAGFPCLGSVIFKTSMEFNSSSTNGVSVTLTNSGSNWAYFIVWQGGLDSNGPIYYGGPDYSIWYYGTTPP